MRYSELNVPERQAWWTLGVFGVTLILYLLGIAVFGVHWWLTGIWGLFGLAGFTPLIGRREKREGRVVYDERDRQIELTANTIGFVGFYMLFIIAVMTPFYLLGPNATVSLPTSQLSSAAIFAMIVVFTLRSLVTVTLYRGGRHG